MEINQIAVIGAFEGKDLRMVIVKNGDTSMYKCEKMGFEEIADFLKDLSSDKGLPRTQLTQLT